METKLNTEKTLKKEWKKPEIFLLDTGYVENGNDPAANEGTLVVTNHTGGGVGVGQKNGAPGPQYLTNTIVS